MVFDIRKMTRTAGIGAAKYPTYLRINQTWNSLIFVIKNTSGKCEDSNKTESYI